MGDKWIWTGVVTSGQRGNFFAIDRHQWAGVCELGMNAALLYLVMGCGTDRSNTISCWSAHALEKNTTVARSRAKAARNSLLQSEFVVGIRGGKHPKYELPRSSGFQEKKYEIWLPNELVTGINGEVTVIERIRQTGDVMRLRLLVELYHQQNLVDECGISRDCVFETYERKKLAESGIFDIWGFSRSSLSCNQDNEAVSPHIQDDDDLFLERFETLRDLGLVVMTPYLWDGDKPDAEIMHPLASVFDCDDLSLETEDAAFRMLPEQYSFEIESHDFIVPVHRHIGNVAVVGIAQTFFRPKTSLTAAGKAHHIDQISEYIDFYKEMAVERECAISR